MNIANFSIRLLTLSTYFLPLVFFLSTCTDAHESKLAYNKKEAIYNEEEKTRNSLKEVDELINQFDTVTMHLDTGLVKELKKKIHLTFSANENISNLSPANNYFFLNPTDYSLSAIGVIFYHKDLTGKIIICLSMFLSLITFIFWKLMMKRKWTIFLISTNIISVFVFVADCLLTHVSILFGVWVLLFLLLIQLLTEIKMHSGSNCSE